MQDAHQKTRTTWKMQPFRHRTRKHSHGQNPRSLLRTAETQELGQRVEVCPREAVNSHGVLQGLGEASGPAETRTKNILDGQSGIRAMHRGKQGVFRLTNYILSGFNVFTGVSPLTPCPS